MYFIVYVCVCVYICVSKMNDSNDTRDGREELEIFCYFKVLTLPIK
jgi:hypothetical protein